MRTQEQRFQQSGFDELGIYTDNPTDGMAGDFTHDHKRKSQKSRKGLQGFLLAIAAFICVISFFSTPSQAGLNRVIVCKTLADVNKLVDLQVDDRKAATAFAYELGKQSRCTLMRIMFPQTDYVDSLEYFRKDGNTIYGTANITLKSGGKVYALIVAHVEVSKPAKLEV